jgi:hypothetical protein
VRFGEVQGKVLIDAPAAAIFKQRDASCIDLLVLVFELYAKYLLKWIEIERVDIWCWVIMTADISTGEDACC